MLKHPGAHGPAVPDDETGEPGEPEGATEPESDSEADADAEGGSDPDPDRDRDPTEAVRRYAAFDRERHAAVYEALADEDTGPGRDTDTDAEAGAPEDGETHGDLTERRRGPDMSDPAPLLSRVVVPVAGPEDAATTAEAVLPHVAAADGHVTAVYVVKKAEGAPDRASVEQLEAHAEETFGRLESRAGTMALTVDTEVVYGPDVVDSVLGFAAEHEASAIAFTPRGRSRFADLITGDLGAGLVDRADRPVVVVPAVQADADTDGDADEAEDEDAEAEP